MGFQNLWRESYWGAELLVYCAMKAKYVFMLFIFLFYLCNVHLAIAVKITPANISDEELEKRIKNDPPNEIKVTFWELPLWIKIHYTVTLCLTTLGLWKFLPLLLTRVKSILENRKRHKIMKTVVENPGIRIKDLEVLTKINRSTLRYHIDVLDSEGLLISIKLGTERLLFPRDFFSKEELELLAVLKSEPKRKLLKLIVQNGGMSARQIADVMGLNLKTVHHHLSSLRAAGVLDAEGGVFHLNSEAHMLLQKVGV